MINYVYQLVTPGNFSVKYEDIDFGKGVIVRPSYMAICHADQRYYLGKRDVRKLRSKLPMALIHEAVGEVVHDSSGKFSRGQKVVMIPNVPGIPSKTIYENYQKGSKFMSSGIDGFMRELVSMPSDRVVPFENVSPEVAAICEFISVGVHSSRRFEAISHDVKEKIGIWGDGSLGFVMALILKTKFPKTKIAAIGRDAFKLSQFSFVDEIHLAEDIPDGFWVDHAFECAGGNGSYYAIKDIIKYINPQGSVMLMGVSENEVPINTRDVLEKGLTLVGSSRSGKSDFEEAVKLLEIPEFQSKIRRIIFEESPVNSIEDIHRVFKSDLNTSFKTVFKWNL